MEAIKVFSEALTLSPRDARLFIMRGDAYREMKEYELAMADFTQALAIDDKLPHPYFARGICYRNRKQYQEALKDFSQVIALKPDTANAYYFRALTYKNLDKNQEALQDVNQAIKLNPDDYHAYFLKGEVCQSVGQTYDAVVAYKKFLSYAPTTESEKIRIANNRVKNLREKAKKFQSAEATPPPPAAPRPLRTGAAVSRPKDQRQTAAKQGPTAKGESKKIGRGKPDFKADFNEPAEKTRP